MSQSQFHDHFSERAGGYALYRPRYPRELVDFLADLKPDPDQHTAWEAGCGSGQLTYELAQRFDHIVATDASADQLAQARPHPKVHFKVARAESSGLADASVDLAVAAQAAHWFDLDSYYREVRRIVRIGGHVALVVYGIHNTDHVAVDAIVKRFYNRTLAGFWPPQRRLVEEEYRTIPFPFEEIAAPRFEMLCQWKLDEMLGYVETWSATMALAKAKGRAEIDAFRSEIADAWSDAQTARTVRWPLSMRLGRCLA